MKKIILTFTVLLALSPQLSAEDLVPAFPGAEGYGRYVTGGRGGKVVHVTNLNDSGPGSLRAAVSGSAKKIVVFDVSGYIDLKSDLKIGANTTIAGQTAPGEGITLRYRTIRPDANNVIIRFIRSRRSQIKDKNDGADAIWTRHQTGIMIDHCSFSWSIDEVASFYDNKNFTMQWTTIGEGLCYSGHNKGAHSYGGIWGGKNASFHHNMIVHVQNRSPRFNGARFKWDGYDKDKYLNTVDAERVDFRNCLIYNWGNGNGCYGGPGGGYINMVNNYYKAGPGTKNKTRVTQASIDENDLLSRYYISGNYVTAASKPENYDWNGVIYDGGVDISDKRYINDTEKVYGDVDGIVNNTLVPMKLEAQIDPGVVTTHDAVTAYGKLLDHVGASIHRDGVDMRYMEEARTGTVTYHGDVNAPGETSSSKTHGILDYINDPSGEENVKTASYPALKEEKRAADFDTDGDGIPDAWERANGLDPSNPSDGNLYTIDPKGWYTNIEVYLNSIVEDIMKSGNSDALTSVDEYYPAYNKSGVENMILSSDVERIEYYDLHGIRLQEPGYGINIRRIIYTDGHVDTDKVIKK